MKCMFFVMKCTKYFYTKIMKCKKAKAPLVSLLTTLPTGP